MHLMSSGRVCMYGAVIGQLFMQTYHGVIHCYIDILQERQKFSHLPIFEVFHLFSGHVQEELN